MALSYYWAYGLSIQSAISLPELLPGVPPADVEVRLGDVEQRPEEHDEDGTGIWLGGGEVCHYRKDVGAFLVRGGREIIADPNPKASEEVVRLAVLGPAFALLLHQRGTFTLHGSSVAINGQAIIFLGPNRAGKSTLAALLQARGHQLLCDDVTPVATDGRAPRVVPSFPQIKLWPESVAALNCSADELPRVHPDFEKRAVRPVAGFGFAAVALRRIYVLRIGERVDLRPLSSAGGYKELLGQWYGARFGSAYLRYIDHDAHFRNCTELARAVAMRTLSRPLGLDELASTIAAVEAELLQDLADETEP